ncbi:MAG: hypothetical protein KGJ13_12200 [Patescibacteria group bacterium]|nr:hypothetical protein [Patescibacteria group bacterium]
MASTILDLRDSKKEFVIKQPSSEPFVQLAASTALFFIIMALIVYGLPLIA